MTSMKPQSVEGDNSSNTHTINESNIIHHTDLNKNETKTEKKNPKNPTATQIALSKDDINDASSAVWAYGNSISSDKENTFKSTEGGISTQALTETIRRSKKTSSKLTSMTPKLRMKKKKKNVLTIDPHGPEKKIPDNDLHEKALDSDVKETEKSHDSSSHKTLEGNMPFKNAMKKMKKNVLTVHPHEPDKKTSDNDLDKKTQDSDVKETEKSHESRSHKTFEGNMPSKNAEIDNLTSSANGGNGKGGDENDIVAEDNIGESKNNQVADKIFYTGEKTETQKISSVDKTKQSRTDSIPSNGSIDDNIDTLILGAGVYNESNEDGVVDTKSEVSSLTSFDKSDTLKSPNDDKKIKGEDENVILSHDKEELEPPIPQTPHSPILESICTSTEEENQYNMSQYAYDKCKALWHYGSSMKLTKPFLEATENAVDKVVHYATGVHINDVNEEEVIKPKLLQFDEKIVNPAIARLLHALAPVQDKVDDKLRPIISLVVKKLYFITYFKQRKENVGGTIFV